MDKSAEHRRTPREAAKLGVVIWLLGYAFCAALLLAGVRKYPDAIKLRSLVWFMIGYGPVVGLAILADVRACALGKSAYEADMHFAATFLGGIAAVYALSIVIG